MVKEVSKESQELIDKQLKQYSREATDGGWPGPSTEALPLPSAPMKPGTTASMLHEHFEKILKIKKNSIDTTIDLGALNGQWEGFLFEYSDKVICVDILSSKNDIIKKRYPEKVNKLSFYTTRGYELTGIESETVDFIFVRDTLTNATVQMIRLYLKEFNRVLRPEGKVLLHLDLRNDVDPVTKERIPRALQNRMGTPVTMATNLIAEAHFSIIDISLLNCARGQSYSLKKSTSFWQSTPR